MEGGLFCLHTAWNGRSRYRDRPFFQLVILHFAFSILHFYGLMPEWAKAQSPTVVKAG